MPVAGQVGSHGVLNHDPFDVDDEAAEGMTGDLKLGDDLGVALRIRFPSMPLRTATEVAGRANCGPVPETGPTIELTSGVLGAVYGPIQEVATVLGFGERIGTITFAVWLGRRRGEFTQFKPTTRFTRLSGGAFTTGPGHRSGQLVSVVVSLVSP